MNTDISDCSLLGNKPMISPEKFSCDQIVVNGNVFLVSGNTPVKAASSGTVNKSESPADIA